MIALLLSIDVFVGLRCRQIYLGVAHIGKALCKGSRVERVVRFVDTLSSKLVKPGIILLLKQLGIASVRSMLTVDVRDCLVLQESSLILHMVSTRLDRPMLDH